MRTDRQTDRQEVDRQRRLCVSVVDRQTDRQVQDQLVVATEQTAAVDQSGPDPIELYLYDPSQCLPAVTESYLILL